ncbi:MAG TPA: adenylate/guanylate cyclase domain-containing protein [Xanthobacteraceae bacterium]|nr:adenylate/guanylate cyclase domain-containing protein [Xanthobacteraceae bacterium]
MRRISGRDALAVIVIALVAGVVSARPALDIVRGLSIDVLTALRWQAFGQRHDPASAPVVVVVIDEDSYRAAPFEGSPTIAWTREIGRVLTSIVEGGASVVGFDIIFPSSIEQSEIPFGDEMLGARLRGFDRDFLRALAVASSPGKVVLGEVQHRDQPIRPSPGQRIAVGQQRNIRLLNVYADADDVVRRLPLTFVVQGNRTPSMAVELASRELGVAPELAHDGTMTLAGYRIPSAVPNTLTLNFEGGAEDIPTFSFADLRACVEKADKEFFRRHFNGKIVLIGSLLDIEDRKLTSKRFATGIEAARAPRCALPMVSTAGVFNTSSISGVYIHATAVDNLIRHDGIVEVRGAAAVWITIAFAALAAVTAVMFRPAGAAFACGGIIAAGTAAATWSFEQSLALPLVEPVLAALAATAVMIGYRFMVVDKEGRFLRRSFGLYLAPEVIEKMLVSNKLPALGGEMRNVTIVFSDIVGFSSIAEKMTPTALVALMNTYLSAMTDIIEENGGYVDKYIGDSIVAVFGAPVDDPDHARKAVRAALRCRACVEELNRKADAFQGHALGHRIGLNSGDALVGNIGSRRRFNYTVMSDAVNLASRLEGANKYFGTSIIASDATVALTGATFEWRELDAIRVKGRINPVRIYEPLAEAGQQIPEQSARVAIYAEALARWRARDFAGAAHQFKRIAAIDRPSALFAARASELAIHPPAAGWEPITTLEGK